VDNSDSRARSVKGVGQDDTAKQQEVASLFFAL
jgi:hypothetical protein